MKNKAKTIGLLLMCAVLLGSVAQEASAGWAWWGKEKTNPATPLATSTEMQGMIERGVTAVNSNSDYLDMAELMGYKRACIWITGKKANEAYTLIREGRAISWEVGCTNTEIAVKTTAGNFEKLVQGLEENDESILTQIYQQKGVIIPFKVKLNIARKCMLSKLC